jgi:hypothetical protein
MKLDLEGALVGFVTDEMAALTRFVVVVIDQNRWQFRRAVTERCVSLRFLGRARLCHRQTFRVN